MSKWRICSHGKHPRLNLEEVRRLAEVVAMNYERRLRGERPDEMHWADYALFVEGYYLTQVD